MLTFLEVSKHYRIRKNYGLIYAVVGTRTPPPLYLNLVHRITNT